MKQVQKKGGSKLEIAVGLYIVGIACKVKEVRTLQEEIKEEHPYKPASLGRSGK